MPLDSQVVASATVCFFYLFNAFFINCPFSTLIEPYYRGRRINARARARLREKRLQQQKTPAQTGVFQFSTREMDLVVHAAHATAHWRLGVAGVLLRQLGDHRLRRDQEAGDRRRILQSATHDLGRIDHALGDEIAVLERLSVVAIGSTCCSRGSCRRRPSRPHRRSSKIWRAGVCSALRTIWMPTFWSSLSDFRACRGP